MTPKTDQDRTPVTPGQGAPLLTLESPAVQEVTVELVARLGSVHMSIAELLALKRGAVVTLDQQINAPVDLLLNQSIVARGTIVAVGDRFGVRIDDVAPAA